MQRYKAILEERRASICALQEMSAESRSAVELDQAAVGRVSRVDAFQAQQMALANERRRREELARIDAALARIENGTFGDCAACGEPIAPKRLDLDPSLTTCVRCASGSAR